MMKKKNREREKERENKKNKNEGLYRCSLVLEDRPREHNGTHFENHPLVACTLENSSDRTQPIRHHGLEVTKGRRQ